MAVTLDTLNSVYHVTGVVSDTEFVTQLTAALTTGHTATTVASATNGGVETGTLTFFNLGNFGIVFGGTDTVPAAVAAPANRFDDYTNRITINPLTTKILSTKSIGGTTETQQPAFGVRGDAAVRIRTDMFNPPGLLNNTALRGTSGDPFFILLGDTPDGQWFHSYGASFISPSNSLFKIDGRVEIQGVTLTATDAPTTGPRGEGFIQDSRIIYSFASANGTGGAAGRAQLFRKSDQGAITFPNTTIVGSEMFPNPRNVAGDFLSSTSTFTGLSRTLAIVGMAHEGFGGLISLNDFTFENNASDFAVERASNNAHQGGYPQILLTNSGSGSSINFRNNGARDYGGDMRLRQNVNLKATNTAGGDVENAIFWLRDNNNNGRKDLSVIPTPSYSSTLNDDFDAYRARFGNETADKTYFALTGADGTVSTINYGLLSGQPDSTETGTNLAIPVTTAIASWTVAASTDTFDYSSTATQAERRKDLRGKTNVDGEDLFDYVIWSYPHTPTVRTDMRLAGDSNIQLNDTLLPDIGIPNTLADVTVGLVTVDTTTQAIATTAPATVGNIYEGIKYLKCEPTSAQTYIEIPNANELVATYNGMLLNVGARNLSIVGNLTGDESTIVTTGTFTVGLPETTPGAGDDTAWGLSDIVFNGLTSGNFGDVVDSNITTSDTTALDIASIVRSTFIGAGELDVEGATSDSVITSTTHIDLFAGSTRDTVTSTGGRVRIDVGSTDTTTTSAGHTDINPGTHNNLTSTTTGGRIRADGTTVILNNPTFTASAMVDITSTRVNGGTITAPTIDVAGGAVGRVQNATLIANLIEHLSVGVMSQGNTFGETGRNTTIEFASGTRSATLDELLGTGWTNAADALTLTNTGGVLTIIVDGDDVTALGLQNDGGTILSVGETTTVNNGVIYTFPATIYQFTIEGTLAEIQARGGRLAIWDETATTAVTAPIDLSTITSLNDITFNKASSNDNVWRIYYKPNTGWGNTRMAYGMTQNSDGTILSWGTPSANLTAGVNVHVRAITGASLIQPTAAIREFGNTGTGATYVVTIGIDTTQGMTTDDALPGGTTQAVCLEAANSEQYFMMHYDRALTTEVFNPGPNNASTWTGAGYEFISVDKDATPVRQQIISQVNGLLTRMPNGYPEVISVTEGSMTLATAQEAISEVIDDAIEGSGFVTVPGLKQQLANQANTGQVFEGGNPVAVDTTK